MLLVLNVNQDFNLTNMKTYVNNVKMATNKSMESVKEIIHMSNQKNRNSRK